MDLNPPRLATLKQRLKEKPIVFDVEGCELQVIDSLEELEDCLSWRRDLLDAIAREEHDFPGGRAIRQLRAFEGKLLKRLVGGGRKGKR